MVVLRLSGKLEWTSIYCLHASPSLLTLSDFPESLRKREGLQFETAKILPSDSVVNPLTSNPKNPIKRILLEPGRPVPAALQPVREELVLEAPQIITIQDRYLVSMAANVDSLKKFLGLLADAFGKLKKNLQGNFDLSLVLQRDTEACIKGRNGKVGSSRLSNS